MEDFMIILGIILYLTIGYFIIAFIERFTKEKEELFYLLVIFFPFVLFGLIFVSIGFIFKKILDSEPSKLRKWIRGF
jgi:Na+-driven multidrug efflux pump